MKARTSPGNPHFKGGQGDELHNEKRGKKRVYRVIHARGGPSKSDSEGLQTLAMAPESDSDVLQTLAMAQNLILEDCRPLQWPRI